MKLSRIDQIALNGGDGAHYKYEEVADMVVDSVLSRVRVASYFTDKVGLRECVVNILVENFPNDAT